MSTTDDSFSVTQDPIDIHKPSLKERWWHIMDSWKVGIIPLPLFVLAGLLIAVDCLGGKLPSDIVVMVATLAFFLVLPAANSANVCRSSANSVRRRFARRSSLRR